MESASLHEALAPCGTLATVAPRTGADGRAETFAAALERVAAAAAAVGARVGSWDVEVAFHLLPDSAAFREVYAVRLEKGGGTTLCGRTGAGKWRVTSVTSLCEKSSWYRANWLTWSYEGVKYVGLNPEPDSNERVVALFNCRH